MASRMEELTVIYRREAYRWDKTVILECDPVNPCTNGVSAGAVGDGVAFDDAGTDLPGWIDDLCGPPPIVVKAEAEQGELVPLLSYRFYGHWYEHPKHGRQFSEAKAKEAAEYLAGEKAMEDCSIDLIDLLGGQGLPKNTAKKAVQEWGNKASELIKRNPYLLMRFRGCGFLRTDAMYTEFGGNPAALKRQAYCAWHSLASNTDGHTWFPVDTVEAGLKGKVAGTEIRGPAALRLAKRGRLLATRRDAQNRLWIAEERKARNEAKVAECVAAMLEGKGEWPDVASMDLSEHQRERLAGALTSRIACFGGGPGTGKTYSAARLIRTVIAQHGLKSVAVAAPTGKAAVRITEVMQGYGVPIRARTIHSLLGVAQRSEGEGWGFKHNEDDPLEFSWVFVDESSMIDTDLMASLLRALATGTHVAFIGDTSQLPPVGHGAPLRDMIHAGVPYGELSEIRRNSGSIVTACHSIRRGERFAVDQQLDLAAGKNLRHVSTASNAATATEIVEILRKIRQKGKWDPVWDCQVVVAVNRKSELSRRELNKVLQAELNPAGARTGSNPFRVGDKVCNVKNSFFPVVEISNPEINAEQSEEGKVFVANGELGKVVSVEEKLTVVALEGPKRLIKIPRGNGDGNGEEEQEEEKTGTGCSWDLGFALSTHRSQGSEWPVVIVGIDEYPGARMICTRNWLYTAASRAKTACFIVGKIWTAYGMIDRDGLAGRRTFLAELIQEKTNAIRS